MQLVRILTGQLAVVAACILLAGCGTATPKIGTGATTAISPDDVSAAQTWGAANNITTLKFLSFSSQPDTETFRIAKSKGITTVVNLRDPSETTWGDREAAESVGLNYVNIPIRLVSDTLDPAAIDAIGEVVKQQEGSPILLYCSSGNRAAAWLATHLIEDHEMSEEAALSVARRAGLTRKSIEKRVLEYAHR